MKIGFRVWILLIILALSLLAIKPSFTSGAMVSSVVKDSQIFNASLRDGAIIKAVNGMEVKSVEEYAETITELFADGAEKRLDITTKDGEITLLADRIPEITVSPVPKTRIQSGLDLRGGARAIVRPEGDLSEEDLQDLIDVSRNRFNTYGLTDLQIRGASDSNGKLMIIEIAGETTENLAQLITSEGKFEARIGNETVFEGGKDIGSVCRNDATCSGVRSCFQAEGGYACNYAFTVYLKEEAAQRHADITRDIPLDGSGKYLTEKIYLYVDDIEVQSLLIGSSLKGQVTTQISIEGSGRGETQEDALKDARSSMKNLQTILITGSLPYKLEIEELDTIPPNLREGFSSLLLFAGGLAILFVGAVVFIRYRNFKASLAMMFTAISELVIILGVAAMIKWNLDIPSIAGILATIGTGVDQQIVVLDEASKSKEISLKERMKRAFFVIGTAYATTLVSLIPLYSSVAGLFKGFAVTTFIGITAGVLITRPAFADMIKKMEE